jgi:sporulation protein YlmC with PRC-barrel domain
MKDMPLKARVICTDGHAGTTTAIIINPVKREVTHVVVESIKYLDFLVPLAKVTDTTPAEVHLDCTIAELHQMRSFTRTHYVHDDLFDGEMYQGSQYLAPYATQIPEYGRLFEEEKVPIGELAVHPGTTVFAKDGRIGELEEFVVEPDTGHVTHIVLRKGHLWGKRDVVIPVSAIDHGDYESLYLNIMKKAIPDLPGVSIQRHYSGQE